MGRPCATFAGVQAWLNDWRNLAKKEKIEYRVRLLLPHANSRLGARDFYIEGGSPTLETHAKAWQWWYTAAAILASNAKLTAPASCDSGSGVPKHGQIAPAVASLLGAEAAGAGRLTVGRWRESVMNNTLGLILLSLSLVGCAGHAHEGKKKGGPCNQITSACEEAGFKKGAHNEKKGLWFDCVQPIMAGQTVAGVTLAADVIAACEVIVPNFGQGTKK